MLPLSRYIGEKPIANKPKGRAWASTRREWLRLQLPIRWLAQRATQVKAKASGCGKTQHMGHTGGRSSGKAYKNARAPNAGYA